MSWQQWYKWWWGVLYQGQWGTASVVRGIVLSLPTLGLNRTQTNLGYLIYYYFIIMYIWGYIVVVVLLIILINNHCTCYCKALNTCWWGYLCDLPRGDRSLLATKIHASTHTYSHVCIHMYAYMHTQMSAYMQTYLHAYSLYVCLHTHICIGLPTYVCTYVH